MGGGGALTAIRVGHAMAHRATPAQRRVWCHAATVASRAPQQLSPGSPEPSRAGRIGRVTSGAQRRGARPRHSVRAGCEPAASALRVPSVMKRGRSGGKSLQTCEKFGEKEAANCPQPPKGRGGVQPAAVTTGERTSRWMLLRRARACAGVMAPERSPTVGRTIVIVTCPSSDQGQMSSFSAS